jgi:hypothetical protein
MPKAQIVVLIILFTALAYVGVVDEGRNRLVAVATIAIFAALVYGGVLQDRARSKAYRPGTSIFSIGAMIRALFTRETFYLVLLTLAIAALAGTMIVLDEAGYLSR